jgi:hypothetical protein
METPTDDQIADMLVGIISDGFNRSLGALAEAGAIETTNLRKQYTGIGSKFYDLVTEQIVYTAKVSAPGVGEFIRENCNAEESPEPLDLPPSC